MQDNITTPLLKDDNNETIICNNPVYPTLTPDNFDTNNPQNSPNIIKSRAELDEELAFKLQLEQIALQDQFDILIIKNTFDTQQLPQQQEQPAQPQVQQAQPGQIQPIQHIPQEQLRQLRQRRQHEPVQTIPRQVQRNNEHNNKCSIM